MTFLGRNAFPAKNLKRWSRKRVQRTQFSGRKSSRVAILEEAHRAAEPKKHLQKQREGRNTHTHRASHLPAPPRSARTTLHHRVCDSLTATTTTVTLEKPWQARKQAACKGDAVLQPLLPLPGQAPLPTASTTMTLHRHALPLPHLELLHPATTPQHMARAQLQALSPPTTNPPVIAWPTTLATSTMSARSARTLASP